MRLLKKGGILAFVINSYFMDNIRDHVRDVIEAKGASLLVAYRLPETLFNNTKVTVDIILSLKINHLLKILNSKKQSQSL